MKKLHDRAVQAATRFVERRGYGVLGSDWSCEGLAAKWLTCNCPEGDIAVRFDRVDMLVVGESKALLRHHINAYGSSEALA